MKKAFSICGILFLITITVLLIFGLVAAALSSYDELLQKVAQRLQRPDIVAAIRTKYFPFNKYLVFKNIFTASSVICLLLTWWSYFRFGRRIRNLFDASLSAIHLSISNLAGALRTLQSANLVLFLIGILFYTSKSLYYIVYYPLQHDELWNYNTFITQPFYYSFVVSNNYPLHNLILNCVDSLPYFDREILIRLPNLFTGMAIYLLTFYFTKKFTNNNFLSVVSAIIMVSTPVVTFYSMYARGTLLALLFSLLYFFCIYLLVSKKKTRYLFWLSVSVVMGFYSVPTFIYPFLFGIFYLLLSKELKRKTVITLAVSFFISVLIYLPIYFGVGGDALLNAATNISQMRLLDPPFLNYLRNAGIFFTGFTWGLYISLLLLFYLLKLNKAKEWLALTLILTFPIYSYVLLGYGTPVRAIPFVVISTVASILLFFYAVRNVNRLLQTILLCGIIFMLTLKSHQSRYLNWSLQYDFEAEKFRKWLVKNKKKVIIDETKNFFYAYPSIDYYSRQKKSPIKIVSKDERSNRFENNPNYDSLTTVWIIAKDSTHRLKDFTTWKQYKTTLNFSFYK